MRAEWFDFTPEFKIWLGTNHKPTVRGTDNAIWDRIRLIPFLVSIPEEEQDKHLGEKLKEELPGILAWAVQGCLEWQRHGLGTPNEVVDATRDYRAEMDVLAAFFDECCFQEAGASAPATPLYERFGKWTAGDKSLNMSQTAFGIELARRGFVKKRGNGGRNYWHGLRIIEES